MKVELQEQRSVEAGIAVLHYHVVFFSNKPIEEIQQKVAKWWKKVICDYRGAGRVPDDWSSAVCVERIRNIEAVSRYMSKSRTADHHSVEIIKSCGGHIPNTWWSTCRCVSTYRIKTTIALSVEQCNLLKDWMEQAAGDEELGKQIFSRFHAVVGVANLGGAALVLTELASQILFT
jgi:hypothetical protein